MWLTRFVLYALLFLLVARALGRFFSGIAQGLGTSERPGPEKGVRMARDPICGTFVIPAKALAVRDGDGLHHFCSSKCREAFLARAGR